MGKLDKIDRMIVNILQTNGRASNLEIGRQLNISHDAVRYRIEKLMKDGVIRFFTIEIDPAKLGLQIWADVIISVWNLNPERYDEFVGYLKNNPNIAAVWNWSGKFDWLVEVFAPDLRTFNEITNDIKLKFSDIIKDMETSFVLNEVKTYIYPV